MLVGYEDDIGPSILSIFLPSTGIYVNRDMIHNFSSTTGPIIEDTAKSLAAQQTSLNLLAQVFQDNSIDLLLISIDYLLAKQGAVCAMANTTCCTYINTSREVETWIDTIIQKVSGYRMWEKKTHYDLFSWLPSAMGELFHGLLQGYIF